MDGGQGIHLTYSTRDLQKTIYEHTPIKGACYRAESSIGIFIPIF